MTVENQPLLHDKKISYKTKLSEDEIRFGTSLFDAIIQNKPDQLNKILDSADIKSKNLQSISCEITDWINGPDHKKITSFNPLSLAVESDNPEIVEMLIDRGFTIPNNGSYELGLALRRNNIKIINLLERHIKKNNTKSLEIELDDSLSQDISSTISPRKDEKSYISKLYDYVVGCCFK